MDSVGIDAVARLWIPTDAEIGDLNAPEPGLLVLLDVRGFKKQRGFAFLVLVDEVSGRSTADDACLALSQDEWLGEFVITGRHGDDATGFGQGIEGGLKVGKRRGVDALGRFSRERGTTAGEDEKQLARRHGAFYVMKQDDFASP